MYLKIRVQFWPFLMWKLKWDIFGDFQTLCTGKSSRTKDVTHLLWCLIWKDFLALLCNTWIHRTSLDNYLASSPKVEKIQDSTRTAIVVDKYHYQRAGQATDKRRRQSSIKTIENEDTQKSSSYFHDFSK